MGGINFLGYGNNHLNHNLLSVFVKKKQKKKKKGHVTNNCFSLSLKYFQTAIKLSLVDAPEDLNPDC